MPELPEVETIKRGLEKILIGKRIKSIKIFNQKQFLGQSQFLLGKKINKVERRAKIIILQIDNFYLLVHLKMSGQLIYSKREIENKHTRARIDFTDKSYLYFNDLRKFGWLKLVQKQEYQKIISKFGQEALSLRLKDLLGLVWVGKGPTIKQFLLNQANIAGIGNIYADESLFCSKINPFRLTKTITEKEVKELLVCIKRVLRLAIKHQGTSEQFYRTAEGGLGTYSQVAKVYAKTGQACKNCQAKIIKKKLAGRGTHFCPKCQGL